MSIRLEPMLTTLAQTSTTQILIWVMAMIVLVIGGGIVAVILHRRYHESVTEGASVESLSLHALRQMHAQGGISDEEFETLKKATVRVHADSGSMESMAAADRGGVRADQGFDLTGDPLPERPESGGETGGKNHSGPGAERHPDA